jgi:hypothetical protein
MFDRNPDLNIGRRNASSKSRSMKSMLGRGLNEPFQVLPQYCICPVESLLGFDHVVDFTTKFFAEIPTDHIVDIKFSRVNAVPRVFR